MLARLFGGLEPWSLLPLRIVVGIIFIVHGGQKLFVRSFPGFAESLTKLGIEPAIFWSVIVTLVELLGGIAILVGFLTRWAALLLSINMLVAILVVHLSKGFFVSEGGYEFALLNLAACLTLLLAGAKKPSVDQVLPKEL